MDPAGRKRPLPPGGAVAPAAKKAALALDERQRERLRADVRSLYARYEALVASPNVADEAAFQALLDAAQGNCAARRLAARLIPRFVVRFPNRADTAAALLTDLHEGHGLGAAAAGRGSSNDPLSAPALEQAARRDALTGLGTVLRAVVGLAPAVADRVVARILEHLIRLLGEQSDLDVNSDPESEEGEVDDRAALIALARIAFATHPIRLLAFCVGLLAKPQRGGGSEGSARKGARLMLNGLVLQRPPRGVDLGGGAGSRQPSPAAGSSGRPDGSGCWLGLLLHQDEQLQQWVVQAAAKGSNVPSEVRQILDRFVALLPPPPLPDDSPPPPSSPGAMARGAAAAASEPSPANGGVGSSQQLPRNGLQRTGSGGPNLPHSGRQPRISFPPPLPAPVGRVEPCLLVMGVPRHVSAADLAAEAGAAEAWLLDGAGGDEACLVFDGVKDATRCYKWLNGVPWTERHKQQQQQQQWPPSAPRLRVRFCGDLPAASARHGKTPPSPFVWVSGALSVTPKGLSDLIMGAKAVNLVKELVRVQGQESDMLLETSSAAAAQQITDLLLNSLAPQHAGGSGSAHAAAPGGNSSGYDPPPGDVARPPGSPPWQLAVSGIRRDMQESEVAAAFGPFGRILDLRLPRGGGDTGTVTFAEPAAAQRARDALNGRRLGPGQGPAVRIEWASRWGGSSSGGVGGPPQRGPPSDWDRRGSGPPPLPPGDWGGATLGTSPGSASHPPHDHQQQPPLPPPGSGPGPGGPPRPSNATPPPLRRWPPLPPKWSGRLSKSSRLLAEIVCITPPGPLGGATLEPYRWPEELAVMQRTRLREVVDEYRSSPHDLRAVRRLLPAAGPGSPDDTELGTFVDYLVSKERAGLVRLPAGDGVPHDRNLHLLVPDEGLLREMGALAVGGARPGERALIAVITPVPRH